MRLARAAVKFNDLLASDAYNPSLTFKVQYEPMSFTKIEGVSIRKRQLSLAPDVVLPTRGCIEIQGETYLFGSDAPDYWKGEVIRRTLVIQGADGLAGLTTIADELASNPRTSAYIAVVFSKYMPDNADSSKYPPQYEVFMAGSESSPADSLITIGSKWYMVKESYLSTSGLRIALANELDAPVFETVMFGSKTYNPITDSYSGAGVSVRVMRVKWTEHYKYLSKASTNFERGDMQVFVTKAVTPKSGDIFTLSDGTWKVLSTYDEGSVWSCHVRRA